mgnify:CR=1 FL=1
MIKIDKIKKKFIVKSVVVYLIVLLLIVTIMKTYAGGGKGRLEGHYQMSWDTIFSFSPIFLIGALIISYPFYCIFYKDYKKSKEKEK